MKKNITIFISLAILLTQAGPVFALKAIPKDQAVLNASISARRQEKIQEKVTNKVTRLNDRAVLEIDRRIASLNKLIARLNEVKRLNPSQKSSLITQIQTEIVSLQSQETKIKAESDPIALKSDVQAIIKSYRVYAIFMPKIEIIAAADRMETVADEMSSLSAKLQTRIDDAKKSGKDTTSMQSILTDANAKLSDAKIQGTNAIDAVLALTPDGYPSNISSLRSARKLIQNGHLDLVVALQDFNKVRQSLHSLEEPKSATPSAIATP